MESRGKVIGRSSLTYIILHVRLGVTNFCILALPRVTLGVTAKEVKFPGGISPGSCYW